MAEQHRYRIAACDYGSNGTRIEEVLIHMGGSWQRQPRRAIAIMVEQEPGVCWTWIPNERFDYSLGAEVSAKNGFITTDPNTTTKDNLGELPPINECPFKQGTEAIELDTAQKTLARTLANARAAKKKLDQAREDLKKPPKK